jgi:hypothetical protein
MTDQIKAKKIRTGGTTQPVLCANGRYISLRLTRKLAMACFCTECLGFEGNPADCTSRFCPMYPFRARTFRTREGTLSKAEARLAR